MELKNIDFVTRVVFDVLPRNLEPFVRERLERSGMTDRWEQAFQDNDRKNGGPRRRHDLSDPATQLKLLAFDFEGQHLVEASAQARQQARTVLKVRNEFAHLQRGRVTEDTAMDALVQTRRLFEELELTDAVDEIGEIRAVFLRHAAGEQPSSTTSEPVPSIAPEESEDPQPGGPQQSGEEAPAASGSVLDPLTVGTDVSFTFTSFAHAYNQPMITVEVQVSGAAESVPTLRVSPALVAGERSLTVPGDRVVSVDPGETAVAPVRLVLDRSAMLDIDVGATARFRIELSAGGETRTVWVPEDPDAEGAIDVFGANSWYFGGVDDLEGLRFLASFVRPHQPEIAQLAKEASVLLGRATGSDALNAYQRPAERTDEIVDAICRAIHAHQITYANPPAGWAGKAQRIRTAEEILTDRLGTCLDLTVLLAGVLEEVGIDVQLWLTKGHIFVGYWRADEAGTGTPVMDIDHAANNVGARRVQFVETTMLASTPMYPGLRDLHAAVAGRYLGDRESEVIGVIEMKGARHTGVLPLPTRSTKPDGEVVEIEYRAQERNLQALVRDQISDTARQVTKDVDVPPRIQQWKRELLDLSLKNRLINLTEKAAHELAVPEDMLGTFEDMLHDRVALELEPDTGLGAYQRERGVAYGTETVPARLAEGLADGRRVTIATTANSYSSVLMKLANAARTIIQETGANNLYLSLGTLLWETDGKRLRSPLILVPISLRPRTRAKGSRYQIRLDDTGASTPNHSLLERLRVDLGIEIPGLADPETDAAGIDLAATFDAVRATIAEHNLPFRVEPTVHLGLFNFAGFRLWKDLEDDWRSIMRNPLVHHLALTPGEMFEDDEASDPPADLDDTVAALPTPSDASQTRVVTEAVSGRTIMVQGPPGTGKSQTITNLIVEAMVQGKRVLFVAEKQAALEVVSRRLTDAGVGDLVLNLHDHGQSSTAVKNALRKALDLSADGDTEGVRIKERALRSARQTLIEYRDALHSRNGAGSSYYSARGTELAVPDRVPSLPVPEEFLRTASSESIAGIDMGLRSVAAAAKSVDRRPGHPWRIFGRGVPEHQVGKISDLSLSLSSLVATAQGPVSDLLRSAARPDHLRSLGEVFAQEWMTWDLLEKVSTPEWSRSAQDVRQHIERVWATRVAAFDYYDPAVLHGPLYEVRAELSSVRESFFGKSRKARKAMAALATWERTRPELDLVLSEQIINELIAVRGAVQEASARLATLPGFQQWGQADILHQEARERIPSLMQWFQEHTLPDDPTPWQPNPFRRACAEVFSVRQPFMSQYLLQVSAEWASLEQVLGSPLGGGESTGPLGKLNDGLAGGKDEELTAHSLHLWNTLEHAVQPLRTAGLGETADAILDGKAPIQDLELSFEKGLAIASRQEREAAGNLRGFDGPTHDQLVARFASVSEALREDRRATALARVLAHRTREEPGVGREEVGKLRRDVGGRTMPKVRHLFSKYGAAITRMMPCVLVSPDSAARFIPSDLQLFDIVVFDEASQITPANAIGTMGRGRSVVVVGDSKQMPPTRFAELTRDVEEHPEDDEETVLVDEESILEECRRAGIPQHYLSWHYRSQSESLIAFSNEQYYEGNLASFPGPVALDADPGHDGHGVSMIRVDGHFHRAGEGAARSELRTNPIEAKAIVDEVLARFATARSRGADEPSIGVITFNIQQRDLIETLLRDAGDEQVVAALEAPEGVFVKNLENVQGDERDVILFSVAFSAKPHGDLPLHFGPLNREGGERRLNVAVTRARRQVVVFCSFEPEQLAAERSSSIGVKHLRAYLDLARHGSRTLSSATGHGARADRHRDEITAALEEHGYVVHKAVGLSEFRVDLAIALPEEPQRMLVAVLLDGESWRRRATEYDRDVLPLSVLGGPAGWARVERVWMPDWIHRRAAVLDRLREAVHTAQRAEQNAAVLAANPATDGEECREDIPPQATEHEVSFRPEPVHVPTVGIDAESSNPRDLEFTLADTELVGALSGLQQQDEAAMGATATASGDTGNRARFVGWTPHSSSPRAVLDELSSSRDARRQVSDLAVEIVTAEYPIRKDRLAKLIGSSYGLERVRQTRVVEIWAAIDKGALTLDPDGFVWPAEVDPDRFDAVRSDMLDHLDVEDVHPRELRNAVRAAYRRNAFAEPDAIIRDALNALGGTKLTAKMRGPLEKAYRAVVEES